MIDNNELINGMLKDFKLKNGIEDSNNDMLYILFIKEAIQTILNLTNRYEFPEELRYLVLDLTNDFYLDNSLLTKATNNEISGSIKSVSEAGRQVTFGEEQQTILNSLLSSFINERLSLQMKQINRFRLLYKVKKHGKI